jgi:predicted transcriptional regulator
MLYRFGGSMKTFTQIKFVQSLSKFRLLTCEGEIIAYLIENGPSRPRDILRNTRHSQVSVFNKLKQMSESGIIEKDTKDTSKASHYRICHAVMNKILDIELHEEEIRQFMLQDDNSLFEQVQSNYL